MPMIKQFPGPRTALAWHYVHAYRWLFLLGTLFAVSSGHFLATRADAFSGIANVATIFCACIIGATLREEGHTPFQWRLPVETSVIVLIEMTVTILLLTSLWLCFFAGSAYDAEGALPEMPPLFRHVAFGLLGLSFARQRGTLKYQVLTLFLAFLVGTVTYGLFLPVHTIDAWVGMVPLRSIAASVALVLALVAHYQALVATTRKVRNGIYEEQEDSVPVFSFDNGAMNELPMDDLDLTPVSGEAVPFGSRTVAHQWYALHLFLRTALWHWVFWSCTLGALSWVPFIFSIAGDSDTTFADFISAVALALLTARFGWWWVEPGAHLPVSEWSQSRVFLRMALGSLMAATVFLWSCRALDLWWGPAGELSDALSPVLLLAGLWTGWCGLALGPGLLLGLGLVFVVGSYAGFAHIDTVVTPICLAWLLLLQCYQQKLSGRKLLPALTLLLVSMAGVLAGQIALERGLLPESLAWCLREALGTGLILALLHQHAVLGILSKSTARQLRIALLVLTGGSSLAVMSWGPFHEPEHGVMATYLALGVVPPLFLPFVTVPTYMAWMHTRGVKHKEMRRKMRWTT